MFIHLHLIYHPLSLRNGTPRSMSTFIFKGFLTYIISLWSLPSSKLSMAKRFHPSLKLSPHQGICFTAILCLMKKDGKRGIYYFDRRIHTSQSIVPIIEVNDELDTLEVPHKKNSPPVCPKPCISIIKRNVYSGPKRSIFQKKQK